MSFSQNPYPQSLCPTSGRCDIFASLPTEVVLCGGTADYLQELPALSHLKQHRPGDIKLPDLYSQLNIGNRMADVAGLWEWTVERSFPNRKAA